MAVGGSRIAVAIYCDGIGMLPRSREQLPSGRRMVSSVMAVEIAGKPRDDSDDSKQVCNASHDRSICLRLFVYVTRNLACPEAYMVEFFRLKHEKSNR